MSTVQQDPELLRVDSLTVTFAPAGGGRWLRRRRPVVAVKDVSFTIRRGETFALVGESGSGKSSVARAVMQVLAIEAGTVRLDGVDLAGLKGRAMRRFRPHFQMIFQDPQASLDPRQTIGRILAEARQCRGGRRGRAPVSSIPELLEQVGLPVEFASRYPHELSGGQRQRVGIARAISLHPKLLICDEPVSALDVSVQAQIINLLKSLQQTLGLTCLFIAHNLAVVRHMADSMGVMYLGRLVETGSAAEIFDSPAHPYTVALLSSVPTPDVAVERASERIILTGEIPKADDPPTGCFFHPRCPLRTTLGNPAICATTNPVLAPVGDHSTHRTACHFSDNPQFLELSRRVRRAQ
jgi:peptide/nickel transport system ATP-binding protein